MFSVPDTGNLSRGFFALVAQCQTTVAQSKNEEYERNAEVRKWLSRGAEHSHMADFAGQKWIGPVSRGDGLPHFRRRMSQMELMAKLALVRRHPSEFAFVTLQCQQSAKGCIAGCISLLAETSFSPESPLRGHIHSTAKPERVLSEELKLAAGAWLRSAELPGGQAGRRCPAIPGSTRALACTARCPRRSAGGARRLPHGSFVRKPSCVPRGRGTPHARASALPTQLTPLNRMRTWWAKLKGQQTKLACCGSNLRGC